MNTEMQFAIIGILINLAIIAFIAWRFTKWTPGKPDTLVLEKQTPTDDEKPWHCRICGALDHRHKAKWCPRCGAVRGFTVEFFDPNEVNRQWSGIQLAKAITPDSVKNTYSVAEFELRVK